MNISKRNFSSLLRYPGGKTRAREILYNVYQEYFLDKNFDTVYSVFFGGGSFELFLNKEPFYMKVVANDKLYELINFWKNVQSNSEELYKIVKNLKNVYKIIKQDTWDYSKILNSLKPDYFVHGDDWKEGVQKKTREKVIEVLKEWGGKLVEFSYTDGISSSQLKEAISNIGTTPNIRLSMLSRLLQ